MQETIYLFFIMLNNNIWCYSKLLIKLRAFLKGLKSVFCRSNLIDFLPTKREVRKQGLISYNCFPAFAKLIQLELLNDK